MNPLWLGILLAAPFGLVVGMWLSSKSLENIERKYGDIHSPQGCLIRFAQGMLILAFLAGVIWMVQ